MIIPCCSAEVVGDGSSRVGTNGVVKLTEAAPNG